MGRVRSGLTRLRARTAGDRLTDDGFTIIEMLVAITILAVTMLSLAYGLFGGMNVLQAGRHKTTFLELANAAAEEIRALPYDAAGVRQDDATAPDAYEGTVGSFEFDGRDAVEITTAEYAALIADFPDLVIPVAVQQVPEGAATNRPAHQVTRRVTWTDQAGGTTRRFKRIDVTIDWEEAGGRDRTVSYSTLYYPGNLGPEPEQPPIGEFAVTSTGPSATTGFVAAATLPPTTATTFTLEAEPLSSEGPSGVAITTYTWDFGDGSPTETGATVSHSYASVGRKTITLVLENAEGLQSVPVSKNVIVGTPTGTPAPPGNRGPTASFTATPLSGPGPLSVSVDATASADPDGDPLTYSWVWGDSSEAGTGSSAGHAYQNQGTYELTLTVADPAGAVSSATVQITVTTPTCTVNSASFRNGGSAVDNSINLANSDRPENDQFTFTAVTNAACTAMRAALPTQSGSFNAVLGLTSATSTTKTWSVIANDSSKYNTGTAQSGTFTATGDAGAVPFTISFSAFR